MHTNFLYAANSTSIFHGEFHEELSNFCIKLFPRSKPGACSATEIRETEILQREGNLRDEARMQETLRLI